ncbi:MAG: uracil-DNA glycosylase [Xanthobacteraceae bacterium]|nr:uracil-DNA glycosylase [Xanthobacteraceae bacterium]
MTPDRTKAARELLAFYLEAGVDTLLGETPVDHLAAETPPAPGPATTTLASAPVVPAAPRVPGSRPPLTRAAQAPAAPATAPLAPDTAVMAARDAARSAASLDELRAIMQSFTGCALRVTATQLVFADGNPQARVMFVGEAPGRDEDLAGLPFVGRSGKLLDRMLKAIGLDRTSAYIANIIPWRPPGNRTPTPQESQICLPFILRQIELANPDVLVCMGGPSSQTLLGYSDGIRRTRGRWVAFNTGTREIRAIATFHPAYLLRSPLEKRHAWRDFLAIKQALAQSKQ